MYLPSCSYCVLGRTLLRSTPRRSFSRWSLRGRRDADRPRLRVELEAEVFPLATLLSPDEHSIITFGTLFGYEAINVWPNHDITGT